MIFSKESTHYYIISNIWIATAILAEYVHDVMFAAAGGLIWFIYALIVQRKEKSENDEG